MIPVTKPFLPPKEEYLKYIDGIWNRQWLTNMGPLASQLEMELKERPRYEGTLYEWRAVPRRCSCHPQREG